MRVMSSYPSGILRRSRASIPMLVLSVVAKVAWPSPTKRSTWHITNILSVATLRRDGGAGRDPTSEQPSVIRLPRTPRSARDTTDWPS